MVRRVGRRSLRSPEITRTITAAERVGRHSLRSPEITRTITAAEVAALREEGRFVTQGNGNFVLVDGFQRFKLVGKSRIEPGVESDLTSFDPGLERSRGGQDVITF